MNEVFRKFAEGVSKATGSSWAFLIALLVIIIWAVTGPIFHFSSTWQLIINTGTTIVTFLMVFLVQNAQNREAEATQIKLDELIYSIKKARNQIIDVEDLSDEELQKKKEEFIQISKQRNQSRRK
jgi:low affinity Fe/Cu permease